LSTEINDLNFDCMHLVSVAESWNSNQSQAWACTE